MEILQGLHGGEALGCTYGNASAFSNGDTAEEVSASINSLRILSRLHVRELQEWDQIVPPDLLQKVVQVANRI